MSISEIVLAQYEKSKAATTNTNKVSNEDRLKKYFVTVLPKGVRNAEKRIRILPPSDGGSPFKEVLFHEFNVDGKWVKLYDPAQDNERSPLNEVHDGLMMTGTEENRKLAIQYRPRKFYVVKVIDRDNEQDGVKFWRFKSNYKGDGIFDKIIPIFKSKGDITNPEDGRDLILSISLTTAGNGMEYATVNSIIQEDKSPLHENAEIAKEWITDELSWEDVYSKKPVEYLELVALGKTPKWNSDLKRWVAEDDETGEENFGAQSVNVASPQTTTTVDTQADEEEDEDLPF